jgi:hypothetical protein
MMAEKKNGKNGKHGMHRKEFESELRRLQAEPNRFPGSLSSGRMAFYFLPTRIASINTCANW